MGEIKAARYSHQRHIFYDGFYVLAKSGSLARGGGLVYQDAKNED